MNVYMTEEEQVEQLKKWWNQYGNMIITAILVVVLAVQGYRWYDNRQLTVLSTASNAFNGMMESVAKQDDKATQSKANFLRNNYQNTIYASSATLFLAKQAVDAKEYDKAVNLLTWVVEHAQSKTFKQLAQLRLARVHLFQKQYNKAIDAIKVIDEPLFTSLVHELKGDIYIAQGKKTQAAEQYQLALSSLPNPALAPQELRIKLNKLSPQQSQIVNQSLGEHVQHG